MNIKQWGMVEWLVFVVVMSVILLILGFFLTGGLCDRNTFECYDLQVDRCLKSERYTRAECIQLIGVRH